jgi:hypothetical protein
MAAKGNLSDRGKPSQVKPFTIPNQKRRLRKIVLRSHGLENGVIDPVIQQTDCRGVAVEDLRSESIDLIQW